MLLRFFPNLETIFPAVVFRLTLKDCGILTVIIFSLKMCQYLRVSWIFMESGLKLLIEKIITRIHDLIVLWSENNQTEEKHFQI